MYTKLCCFIILLFVLRWKDPNCEFRTHPKLLLKGIPTLMKWGTVSRTTFFCISVFICPCIYLCLTTIHLFLHIHRFPDIFYVLYTMKEAYIFSGKKKLWCLWFVDFFKTNQDDLLWHFYLKNLFSAQDEYLTYFNI